MKQDRRIQRLRDQQARLATRLANADCTEARNNVKAIIRAVEGDIRRLSVGGVRRW